MTSDRIRSSRNAQDRVARSAAMLLLVLFSTGNVLAQPVNFARDDYAAYAGARAIASADFNRDGSLDLALATNGRNSITILLNRSGTGFLRSADVPVGAGPFDLVAADFNRDAIPDLAVANADGNSISVLLGKGDGTFARRDIPAVGQGPRGIAAGDVNNDGKPDLLYTGYITGIVQVLNGNGAGGFTKGSAWTASGASPQGLAAGDFNHDGRLDVAVATASAAGLRILYGNGGTAFTARTIGAAANLNVVAVGDFNRDGWIDVAAASTSNSTVTIYKASATGLVATQTVTVGSSPRGVTAADVNDDGLLDLVTANRATSTVSVILGDRAHPGAFLAPRDVAANTGSRAVVAADFNRDGVVDLATADEFASAATVLSNTTAFDRAGYAFHPSTLGSNANYAAQRQSLAVADFNRDGKTDIATTNDTISGINVLLAGGPEVPLPVSGSVGAVTTADLNADGNPDLVYLSKDDPMQIGAFIGDGIGHFTASTMTPLVGSGDVIVIGDLNRDGRPDVAYLGGNGSTQTSLLQLLLGRGDGTFQAQRTVALAHYPELVGVADVNRDGNLDVALATGQIWLGDGAGGVQATPMDATVSGSVKAAVDVNRDGYLDLVVRGTGYIDVVPGSETGFGPAIRTSPLPEPDYSPALAVGDLNVDGNVDFVLAAGSVMLGSGDGNFTPAGRFDFSADAWTSTAYDLRVVEATGDGLPDILAVPRAGQVRVLANQRTSVNTLPTVDAGPDRSIDFADVSGEDCDAFINAAGMDADAHFLSYEWRNASGSVVSDQPTLYICTDTPGSSVYTVTVRDGRGGVASDSVTVTRVLTKEIVLWAGELGPIDEISGSWTQVADPTAAGGVRLYDPNLGAPKVNAPIAFPQNRVAIRFYPEPTLTYKLWVRLKADGNSWANDSVWMQFSTATDVSGAPKYQWGSNEGLSVNLEECSGCGESGWGWEDDGWGAVNTNGVLLRFPSPDNDGQVLVIQTREDGVSIDQIVLSAEKYLTRRPGAAKKDTTILPKTPR